LNWKVLISLKEGFLYTISENEYLLFRDYINEQCGIVIPPEKIYLLETRLTKIMLDAGADSFGELYLSIKSDPGSAMHQKIIDALTTNETLWFRDSTPWKVLEDQVLPRLVNDLLTGRKARVRIWSAAVSTGQEIYSTVMCVDNYLKKNNVKGIDLSKFDFVATDISSNALYIAKSGRYTKISIMRGMNDYYKSKYFTENDSAWDIAPEIKSAVRFTQFNLKDDYHKLGQFDIIFCRYVLIYFSTELKKEIIKKMQGLLTEGGVLFTGNYILYELFRDGFDINYYDNLTYYSKKAGSK
jgi:chemotaxis protein methyltransferase CheR